ncbi:MAG TPA: hypothetical protein VE422_08655 [Terriglobia bacterium]|nr:hypothetical protein [Terriglobia bacterium]
MRTESPDKFAIGDAILVVGTGDDGKVGTIIRLAEDHQYVVALEDGTEVLLDAEDMTLRR